jgi:hypothetical protein
VPALLCATISASSFLVVLESAASKRLLPFNRIYESSGVAHLGQGEFVVVEDEPAHPLHRLKLDQNGHLIELGPIRFIGDPVRLNDLEGITFDGRYLYAVTSHSLTKRGTEGKDRTVLVRFEYTDGRLRDARRINNLKGVLVRRFSEVFSGKTDEQIESELNIEALAWSPQDDSLYIGFRQPLKNGLSTVMRIQSPRSLFEQRSAAGLAPQLFWLDLQGKGIRSMNWDTEQAQFMIVAGRKGADGGFDLWHWRVDNETGASKISATNTLLPEGTEGLAGFVTEKQSGVLLVIDDGNAKKSRAGHYQLFPK